MAGADDAERDLAAVRDQDLHKGMLPCFLGGLRSRLVASVRSASMSRQRVSRGSITSSTYPRLAAEYGLANLAVYSAVKRASAAVGSGDLVISSLKRISTAPLGPMTAISAVGHARLRSPRMCLELMTSYAPPYAFRVITVSLGTVASQ